MGEPITFGERIQIFPFFTPYPSSPHDYSLVINDVGDDDVVRYVSDGGVVGGVGGGVGCGAGRIVRVVGGVDGCGCCIVDVDVVVVVVHGAVVRCVGDRWLWCYCCGCCHRC